MARATSTPSPEIVRAIRKNLASDDGSRRLSKGRSTGAERVVKPSKPPALPWYDIAGDIGPVLSMARRGDREATVATLSQAFQSYPKEIRRFLTARAFLDQLDEQDLAIKLRSQPAIVVEVLANWHRLDPKTALSHAHEVTAGEWSFRGLRTAAQIARIASRTTPEARSNKWLELGLLKLRQGRATDFVEFAPGDPLEHLPVDLWIRKNRRRVAVQLPGPFPNRPDYMRGMWTRIAVAIAVTQLGFEAWLCLPLNTHAERYRDAAKKLAPTAPIEIFELDMRAFDKITKRRS
ncbi:MAG: hypothetical protein ABSA13_16445 [Beijerinckiaceae bacterium]|jgi:hypothetical protein